jgi:hypothetical protein
MNRRFQFSARNLLIAMTLVAVWCGVFFAQERLLPPGASSDGRRTLWVVAALTIPAAGAGALVGRPVLGVFCGLCSSLAWIAIVWQSINS